MDNSWRDLPWSWRGSWSDLVVSPKDPRDERRPTGALVKELFDLSQSLPERKPFPEPVDDAQAYVFGKLKDAQLLIDHLKEEALARFQLQEESRREIYYQI